MKTTNWETGVVGSWQDAANWTNGVPGGGDTAVVGGTGSSVTNGGTVTNVFLSMSGGGAAADSDPKATFDNKGTMFAINGGTLDLDWGGLAPQAIYNEGLIEGSPGASIVLSSPEDFPTRRHGGPLSNSGTIETNGATMVIAANVTQTATGVTEIDNGSSVDLNATMAGGLLKFDSGAMIFGQRGPVGNLGRSVAAMNFASKVEFDGPADIAFPQPLKPLVFDPVADTLTVVGDVDSQPIVTLQLVGTYTADEFGLSADGWHMLFKPTPPVAQDPPPATQPPPVVQDPPPAAGNPPPATEPPSTNFAVLDTTTNTPSSASGTTYSGPVAGLNWQYLNMSPDNLNITSGVPNAFIHSGSGQDAIDVSHANGNNVLDGWTGSNFLVGGAGTDTFFLDDRTPPGDLWSTLVNFHGGDSVTVWGLTANDFQVQTADNEGAAGFGGLTFHFIREGQPTASLTLTGFSAADLSNGRLAMSYGRTDDLPGLPGSNYLSVHGA
jgi:hypothetical protein